MQGVRLVGSLVRELRSQNALWHGGKIFFFFKNKPWEVLLKFFSKLRVRKAFQTTTQNPESK